MLVFYFQLREHSLQPFDANVHVGIIGLGFYEVEIYQLGR
jgi:hypothetical protein